MTAPHFGRPAFRNRHFVIWGGGAEGGGAISIPALAFLAQPFHWATFEEPMFTGGTVGLK